MQRPIAGRLAFFSSAQRLDHLLGRDRDLIDPDADRVVHGRADRGRDRQQGALSGLLRAVRPLGIDGLDDERLHLGHVEKCRRLVLQHRRPLVEALAKRLLFHERLAKTHVDAALDLPFDQQRIDRAADVMGDPDPVHVDESRAGVDVEVDHARRVAVGRARSDPRALVRTGDPRRRVAARACERAVARLGQHAGLLEAEAAYPAVAKLDLRCVAACFCRHGPGEHRPHLACGLERRVACHERDPR